MPKKVQWVGSSKEDLSAFPRDAKQDAGHQLHRVELGLDPDDWKPVKEVGKGVREICVSADSGEYRAMYTTSVGDAVYVLHVFQKKTRRTSKPDIGLAKHRLKELLEQLRQARRNRDKSAGMDNAC